MERRGRQPGIHEQEKGVRILAKKWADKYASLLQLVAVCCSVLQCAAVCSRGCAPVRQELGCQLSDSVAACCSVLQCVAVCCSVLQKVCVSWPRSVLPGVCLIYVYIHMYIYMCVYVYAHLCIYIQ